MSRKIRRKLEARKDLALTDRRVQYVFQYLFDKRLVGASVRTRGRYGGYTLEALKDSWLAADKRGALTSIPVYETDIWMADPGMPSTIGVPTPENVEEVLELAVQLGLVSRSTYTWTATGQTVQRLRGLIEVDGEAENPFLLRVEAAALLRQVLEADGPVLRAMVRFLADGDHGSRVRTSRVHSGK